MRALLSIHLSALRPLWSVSNWHSVPDPKVDAAFNALEFSVSLWFKANTILAGSPRLFEKQNGAGDFRLNPQGAGTNNRFRHKADNTAVAGNANDSYPSAGESTTYHYTGGESPVPDPAVSPRVYFRVKENP